MYILARVIFIIISLCIYSFTDIRVARAGIGFSPLRKAHLSLPGSPLMTPPRKSLLVSPSLATPQLSLANREVTMTREAQDLINKAKVEAVAASQKVADTRLALGDAAEHHRAVADGFIARHRAGAGERIAGCNCDMRHTLLSRYVTCSCQRISTNGLNGGKTDSRDPQTVLSVASV